MLCNRTRSTTRYSTSLCLINNKYTKNYTLVLCKYIIFTKAFILEDTQASTWSKFSKLNLLVKDELFFRFHKLSFAIEEFAFMEAPIYSAI